MMSCICAKQCWLSKLKYLELLKHLKVRVMEITPCCPSFPLDESQHRPQPNYHSSKTIPGALPKSALIPNSNITPCAPTFMTEPTPKRRRMQAPETAPKAKALAKLRPRVLAGYPAHASPVPKQPMKPRQDQGMEQEDVVEDPNQWWISKSLRLPDDRRNGWVLAWII